MSTSLKTAGTPGVDEYRWLRAKHGNIPVDQIAREDEVDVAAVEKSVMRVERMRARLTLREIHAAEMKMLLASVKDEVGAINSALRATKNVFVLDERGRPLEQEGKLVYQVVPDHETRLAAVKTRTEILNAIQPKGGGVSVSMSQQVAVSNGGSRRGVESRIIAFNAAREQGLTLPPAQDADDEADEA